MERVTFHRAEVKKLLSGMVCMKINAGGRGGHPLAERFGVSGFPTLVLLDPMGETIYKAAGAPSPAAFADFFVAERYNAVVSEYNAMDWKAAAPHFFFLRTFFGNTRLGKKAEGLYDYARKQEGFSAAYEATQKAYEAKLEKARAAAEVQRKKAEAELRKKEERRAEAKALIAKADELYGKYMKNKSFKIYKQVILAYPELPEAERAREVLRKHKKKWKEPE